MKLLLLHHSPVKPTQIYGQKIPLLACTQESKSELQLFLKLHQNEKRTAIRMHKQPQHPTRPKIRAIISTHTSTSNLRPKILYHRVTYISTTTNNQPKKQNFQATLQNNKTNPFCPYPKTTPNKNTYVAAAGCRKDGLCGMAKCCALCLPDTCAAEETVFPPCSLCARKPTST